MTSELNVREPEICNIKICLFKFKIVHKVEIEVTLKSELDSISACSHHIPNFGRHLKAFSTCSCFSLMV